MRIRCATIQASGVLDDLSLAHYDPSSRCMGPARHFRGSLQLISAHGILAEAGGKLQLQLQVLASRQRDNGIEVLGGTCLSAKLLHGEFVIDSFEDVILRRTLDKGTGVFGIHEAFSSTSNSQNDSPKEMPPPDFQPRSPTPMVETKASWADAVMASVRASSEPSPDENDEEDEPYRAINPGDLIDHQQFGRCTVERIDADQEFVTVRLRNNRLVRLSTDVLRLKYQGEENGHQVFMTRTGTTGGE